MRRHQLSNLQQRSRTVQLRTCGLSLRYSLYWKKCSIEAARPNRLFREDASRWTSRAAAETSTFSTGTLAALPCVCASLSHSFEATLQLICTDTFHLLITLAVVPATTQAAVRTMRFGCSSNMPFCNFRELCLCLAVTGPFTVRVGGV